METVSVTQEAVVFDKTERAKIVGALEYVSLQLETNQTAKINLAAVNVDKKFITYILLKLKEIKCI